MRTGTTYRAAFFEHPVAYEFTVEEPGWTWYYSGNFRIVADNTPTDSLERSSEGIYVQLFPVAASTTCVEKPEPGVAQTVDDWPAGLSSCRVSTSRAGSPSRSGGWMACRWTSP